MNRDSHVGRAVGLSVIGILGLVSFYSCGGGGDGVTGAVAAGQKIYNTNCALCHGQGGTGKPALGADLRGNQYIAGMSDDEVVQFLKVGRRADHPLNDKGVDMPPKGGNPGLTDDDLRQIVAYLRSLS